MKKVKSNKLSAKNNRTSNLNNFNENLSTGIAADSDHIMVFQDTLYIKVGAILNVIEDEGKNILQLNQIKTKTNEKSNNKQTKLKQANSI